MEQQTQYIFGDPAQDRLRLQSQTHLLERYIRQHAREFAGDDVQRILDVGCGEGQLGFALQEVYPQARLLGIDRDEAAIQRAITTAGDNNNNNAEFVVGDVQAGLPAGPFDLVLASLVLIHTQQPAAVLRHAFEQMSSGGTLLVIDLLPDMATRFDDSNYERIFSLMFTAYQRIGAHPFILDELPALAAGVGFVDYQRHETEGDHPFMTNKPMERSWAVASGVGAIYNARHGISAATGVPVAEIEQMSNELVGTLNRDLTRQAPLVCGVATARKP